MSDSLRNIYTDIVEKIGKAPQALKLGFHVAAVGLGGMVVAFTIVKADAALDHPFKNALNGYFHGPAAVESIDVMGAINEGRQRAIDEPRPVQPRKVADPFYFTVV